VAKNGSRNNKRTMEFVIAKKMEPSGERKNRTVAVMVRIGVMTLLMASLGPGFPPPPPPGGRLYPICRAVGDDKTVLWLIPADKFGPSFVVRSERHAGE
jgi:hypothetical protein